MRTRRALAAIAVTVGMAAGATVAVGGGTAYAYGCTTRTADSRSPAHGWNLEVCKWQWSNGSAHIYWQAWTNDSTSTDVRVWFKDPCSSNDGSPVSSQHVDPANGYVYNEYSAYDCDWQAELTESNNVYIGWIHTP